MSSLEYFPNIKIAALAFAYDNGIINRTTTQGDWLHSVSDIVSDQDPTDVMAVDQWLQSLTSAQTETLMAGEMTEAASIGALAPDPVFLEHLLDLISEA